MAEQERLSEQPETGTSTILPAERGSERWPNLNAGFQWGFVGFGVTVAAQCLVHRLATDFLGYQEPLANISTLTGGAAGVGVLAFLLGISERR